VHALGDGGEELGVGRALRLWFFRRELNGAFERWPGGEAARDIDGDAVMLERQRLDDAGFVVLRSSSEIAEPPACRSAAISRARLPS
jgi:hypothetical protein